MLLLKDASITAPAPDSADDPRCGASPSGTVKASLAFASVSTGQSHTTPLPCQNWSLLGSSSNPKGYKYADKELDQGTAKKVIWKNGSQLKAILSGKGPSVLDFDLQLGVPAGSVAAMLSNGSNAICASCLPSNRRDGSDGRTFLGKGCPTP